MQKILVIVAIVFSLAAAGVGYLNRGKLIAIKEESAKYQADLSASQKKSAASAAELKSANEKIAILDSDKEKVAAELVEVRSQKEEAVGKQSDLQKQISERDATLAQQKTDLTAKDARIAELESKASQVVQPQAGQADELKKQLDEKDILNTSLQTKLKDQDSQLASLKEREAQRRAKMMRPGLEGRILAVNSSWGFVVLSLGDRNGVVSGAEMLIKRGAQLIGKVRITSVEPSSSIADIVANSVRNGLSVLPGDSVIYSGPAADDQEPKTP